MKQSISETLNEAETSEDTSECVPCRIAAGIGITRNLCQEFKELDCHEIMTMLDNPENFTVEEAEEAIKKLAQNSRGKPRELLDYTLSLMRGEGS